MDKSLGAVLVFGALFIGLFLLSLFVSPDSARQPQNDEVSFQVAQANEMEEQLREEQDKYFRSRAEDEELYYKETAPHDIDDPDFFDEPHPLKERPLEEEPLDERPLRGKSLQEDQLPDKLLR